VHPAGEITPRELHAWSQRGGEYLLLDVRQPEECRVAAFPGALNLPMREIPARLAEIPKGKPVVVVCHYGERSARVAGFLAARGFEDVYNLEGGIDAYAVDVDPRIPRY
jgi:rhodanese-related sulfurtransferase